MNPPSPPILDGVLLPTTIKYPNFILQRMHESAVREREDHIDMLWARHKREAAKAAKEKEAKEASESSSAGAGLVAPDIDSAKRGSKKGERKQAEIKASEAQQAAATNRTVGLAMGKKGAPAWMMGGGVKSGASSSRPGGTSLKNSAPKTRADIAAITPPVRVWGQFKEKKTMDMRDIIFVLEADGTPSKRILGLCYLRRGSPGGMAKGWN